jgi:hypothetical protein
MRSKSRALHGGLQGSQSVRFETLAPATLRAMVNDCRTMLISPASRGAIDLARDHER